MATLTLQGKIKRIHDTVSRVHNDKDFKTRTFWIEEVKDQYPATWSLETQGEKTTMLDNFKEGDLVDCKIELIGRFYVGKDGKEGVFNSLKCFGVYKVDGQQNNTSTTQKKQAQPPIEKDLSHLPITNGESSEELPF
jgi:hypothetical protein